MTPTIDTEAPVVELVRTQRGVMFAKRARNRERVEPMVDERRYITLFILLRATKF
jgi:hypothetical protein